MDVTRNFDVLLEEDQNFIEESLERGQISETEADLLVVKKLSSEQYAHNSSNGEERRLRDNIPTLKARKRDDNVARMDTLINGWHIYREKSSNSEWFSDKSGRRLVQPVDLNENHNSWMLDENFLTGIRDKQRIHINTDISLGKNKRLLVELREVQDCPKTGWMSYNREIDHELNMQTLDQMAANEDKIRFPDTVPYNWLSYWDNLEAGTESWDKMLAHEALPGSEPNSSPDENYMGQFIYMNALIDIFEDLGEITEVREPKMEDEDRAIYKNAAQNRDTIITCDQDFYGSDPFPDTNPDTYTDVVMPQIAYKIARDNI